MKSVTFAISTLSGGGAERVVSVWANALSKKGFNVSIIVYSRVDNEYEIDDSVKIYTIANSSDECQNMSIMSRIKAFRSLFKEINPDVVISFLAVVQIYVYLASIGLKIKRIETIRISPWDNEILKTKLGIIWLKCFDTCKALIVQTKGQLAFFKKKVQDKAVVIPNPINENYIENKKGNYNISSHKIVAAGRLTEQKNYKMMIDAVNIVKNDYNDVSLSIFGVGNLENMLNDYINELCLQKNVKLMGRSNSLYNIYLDSDLYLMSSDFEGMPNALAEAMAIGLPCISTDCRTGPSDLIDDGKNGFLVECGNANLMAEKIKQIFSMSEEEQRNLGENARNKAISFCSEENSLNKLIGLLNKL